MMDGKPPEISCGPILPSGPYRPPLPVAGGGTQVTCGSALLSGRLLVDPPRPSFGEFGRYSFLSTKAGSCKPNHFLLVLLSSDYTASSNSVDLCLRQTYSTTGWSI